MDSIFSVAITFLEISTWLAFLVGAIFHRWVMDKVGLVAKKDLVKFENDLKASYGKDLAKVKSELELENAKDIARISSSLQEKAKYKEIQYGELRKQQTEVFEKYYEKLSRTYLAAAMVTSPKEWDDDFEGRKKKFNDNFLEFQDYYLTKKIFFPIEICKRTENLLEKLLQADLSRQFSKDTQLPYAQQLEHWQKAWDTFSGICSELKVEIEDIFRKLLGSALTS